jgi:hypothetical protein
MNNTFTTAELDLIHNLFFGSVATNVRDAKEELNPVALEVYKSVYQKITGDNLPEEDYRD